MFIRAAVCVSAGAVRTKAGNVVHFPLRAMLALGTALHGGITRPLFKTFLPLPYTS